MTHASGRFFLRIILPSMISLDGTCVDAATVAAASAATVGSIVHSTLEKYEIGMVVGGVSLRPFSSRSSSCVGRSMFARIV